MKPAAVLLSLSVACLALYGVEAFRLQILRSRLSDVRLTIELSNIDASFHKSQYDLYVWESRFTSSIDGLIRNQQGLDRIVRDEKARVEKAAAASAVEATVLDHIRIEGIVCQCGWIGGLCLFGLGLAVMPGFFNQRGAEATSDRQIFVSYNHLDLELARSVCDALRRAGLTPTLIDTILDVKDDAHLRQILGDHIRVNGTVLVLLTPNSLRSNWVGFERVIAETATRNAVYLLAGVGYVKAVRRTLLLHKAASFKFVKSIKATRRFVDLDSAEAWVPVVKGYAAAAQDSPGRSVRRLLVSYTSIDALFFQWLFDAIESRAVVRRTKLWRTLEKAAVLGQLYFCVGVLSVIVLMFVGTGYMAIDNYQYHQTLRDMKLEK